eukprot:TRINITY_DN2238_c0_g1_i1.p1 TRINITY_DN2238_c0_g1~~TRINITY_DN2238_c0_g1_i1.p1  ORF type:complete len:110 (+),score=16.83 TRINITY_DN2238_c0_g1_i1:59-388(+)
MGNGNFSGDESNFSRDLFSFDDAKPRKITKSPHCTLCHNVIFDKYYETDDKKFYCQSCYEKLVTYVALDLILNSPTCEICKGLITEQYYEVKSNKGTFTVCVGCYNKYK